MPAGLDHACVSTRPGADVQIDWQVSLPAGSRECLLGQTFSVTQSGDRVEISNEKGEALVAGATTETFLTMGAPWNALGVIYGSDIQ